jgi:hypothetical protein
MGARARSRVVPAALLGNARNVPQIAFLACKAALSKGGREWERNPGVEGFPPP